MPNTDTALNRELDKLAIVELAQTERAARDARDWDRLLDSYHPDSLVQTSWFRGTGQEFVEASRRRVASPGGDTFHQVGPTIVDLHGDRAIADTGCVVHLRKEFNGVLCDIAVHCRHRSRVERREGNWRLRTLIGVYNKDTLIPTDPRDVPELDAGKLARYRSSYRFISYLNAELSGQEAPDDRPGMDRPDLVEALVVGDRHWLVGGAEDAL